MYGTLRMYPLCTSNEAFVSSKDCSLCKHLVYVKTESLHIRFEYIQLPHRSGQRPNSMTSNSIRTGWPAEPARLQFTSHASMDGPATGIAHRGVLNEAFCRSFHPHHVVHQEHQSPVQTSSLTTSSGGALHYVCLHCGTTYNSMNRMNFPISSRCEQKSTCIRTCHT